MGFFYFSLLIFFSLKKIVNSFHTVAFGMCKQYYARVGDVINKALLEYKEM